MPNTKLDRLLFEQGGRCFFCQKLLPKAEASIEHLLAQATCVINNDENLVVCCKTMNAVLGSKPLKEKLRILLNQPGKLQCPKPPPKPQTKSQPAAKVPDDYQCVLANLRKRSPALPKTLPKLKSSIASLFRTDSSCDKIATLVDRLEATGKIKLEGETITYAL